jgi:hypothetical protein
VQRSPIERGLNEPSNGYTQFTPRLKIDFCVARAVHPLGPQAARRHWSVSKDCRLGISFVWSEIGARAGSPPIRSIFVEAVSMNWHVVKYRHPTLIAVLASPGLGRLLWPVDTVACYLPRGTRKSCQQPRCRCGCANLGCFGLERLWLLQRRATGVQRFRTAIQSGLGGVACPARAQRPPLRGCSRTSGDFDVSRLSRCSLRPFRRKWHLCACFD